jgi:hypothetical protein
MTPKRLRAQWRRGRPPARPDTARRWELGSLVGQWRGPTLPLHPDWPGEFAIEAHELEVGSWVGHVAILVIATQHTDPADDRFYLVQPPGGPLAVGLFGETDYVAMFELASSPHAHRAVPAGQCAVLGRVTYLIAPM